jgi:hypothetical protein
MACFHGILRQQFSFIRSNERQRVVVTVTIADSDNQTIIEYRSLTAVRVLTAADSLTGGDVLPDFACPVQELFT